MAQIKLSQYMALTFMTAIYLFAFFSYRGSYIVVIICWLLVLLASSFFENEGVDYLSIGLSIFILLAIAGFYIRWNKNMIYEFKNHTQKLSRFEKILGKSNEGIIILKD